MGISEYQPETRLHGNAFTCFHLFQSLCSCVHRPQGIRRKVSSEPFGRVLSSSEQCLSGITSAWKLICLQLGPDMRHAISMYRFLYPILDQSRVRISLISAGVRSGLIS
mmetsp:Transcript_88262/g.156271  ORF Transcript_88262/g.156271 Transcript_88262/m.156271 type:complete len:109 (+) Transcript_88262:1023-1349(+)